MPSIANQDYKIYGKLSKTDGVPAKYCGELHAAILRNNSFKSEMEITDGFVISSTADSVCRQLSLGFYYDFEEGRMVQVSPVISQNPAYYDALWAIQQAEYAADGSIVGEGMSFLIGEDGSFIENNAGLRFVNEDGYLIKGTIADGKLTSLSLVEKAESTIGIPIVRLETLLPLVGELPLNTTEIW